MSQITGLFLLLDGGPCSVSQLDDDFEYAQEELLTGDFVSEEDHGRQLEFPSGLDLTGRPDHDTTSATVTFGCTCESNGRKRLETGTLETGKSDRAIKRVSV